MSDALRVVALVEGALVIGFNLSVLGFYFRRYLHAHRAGLSSDWVGLLPVHVVGLSVGVSLLVVGYCVLITDLVGDKLRWYASPLAVVAFTVLLGALTASMVTERRMYRGGPSGANKRAHDDSA